MRSAIDQSAIVLMNRKTKTERGVTAVVPACSRVTDMHSHHPQGTNQAQAKMNHCLARALSGALGTFDFADGFA
jgi:hypothetical protein